MSTSDPSFLEKMERESREQQQRFIGHIASRLGRGGASESRKPEHPYRGAPDFWNRYELTHEERIERFMGNWRAAGGHTERVAGWEELSGVVTRILQEHGAQSTIRQDLPELAGLRLEQHLPELAHRVWNGQDPDASLAAAAYTDAGIALVDDAVAYTGSLVVTSSAEKGRSVSLLPNLLIAIVPAERMKTRLGEVMGRLSRSAGEELPAGVHFISGPSRSSDIENDLTIGVHGPGIAYALIVG